jgi:hypothetical protein
LKIDFKDTEPTDGRSLRWRRHRVPERSTQIPGSEVGNDPLRNQMLSLRPK